MFPDLADYLAANCAALDLLTQGDTEGARAAYERVNAAWDRMVASGIVIGHGQPGAASQEGRKLGL